MGTAKGNEMSAPSSDRAAIRQTIRALRAAGYAPYQVNDGEEVTDVRGATENKIIEDLMATDQSWLFVAPAEGRREWVLFVLGNDPEEVINDYTVGLTDIIDPLFEKWEIL